MNVDEGARHIFGNGVSGSIEGGLVEKRFAPRVVSRWAIGLFGWSRLRRWFWGWPLSDDGIVLGLGGSPQTTNLSSLSNNLTGTPGSADTSCQICHPYQRQRTNTTDYTPIVTPP